MCDSKLQDRLRRILQLYEQGHMLAVDLAIELHSVSTELFGGLSQEHQVHFLKTVFGQDYPFLPKPGGKGW